MFIGSFFPPTYFARVYFPSGGPVVRPGYFPHGYFARRWFPDRYFPGPDLVIEPTPPTVISTGSGGGPPPSRYIPPIAVVADLVLPVPEFRAVVIATPAEILAHADLALLLDPVFHAEVQATPAQIAVGAGLVLPSPELSIEALRARLRPTHDRRREAEEEDALLEHYMLTLALTRKGK